MSEFKRILPALIPLPAPSERHRLTAEERQSLHELNEDERKWGHALRELHSNLALSAEERDHEEKYYCRLLGNERAKRIRQLLDKIHSRT